MSNNRYAIETARDALRFCAAHMATFADGSMERLHGHNYQVTARLEGGLDAAGMVVDVGVLKRWVAELCDTLDEYVLIPTRNDLLDVTEEAESVKVRYGDRTYVLPRGDCLLLEIENTTMEYLARWFAERLTEQVTSCDTARRLTALEVSVSETPGQRALWRLDLPAP